MILGRLWGSPVLLTSHDECLADLKSSVQEARLLAYGAIARCFSSRIPGQTFFGSTSNDVRGVKSRSSAGRLCRDFLSTGSVSKNGQRQLAKDLPVFTSPTRKRVRLIVTRSLIVARGGQAQRREG